MNKRILLLALLLLPVLSAGAQGRFAKYLHRVDEAPFILIDKQAFKLWLVDGRGEPVKEYGISCAVNYGQKQRRGDHKTPEGTFKINQLLNSRGIPHDFGDGTPFPESIGTRATEGCIRLRNEDITDLKGRVKLGTTVIILPDISH